MNPIANGLIVQDGYELLRFQPADNNAVHARRFAHMQKTFRGNCANLLGGLWVGGGRGRAFDLRGSGGGDRIRLSEKSRTRYATSQQEARREKQNQFLGHSVLESLSVVSARDPLRWRDCRFARGGNLLF